MGTSASRTTAVSIAPTPSVKAIEHDVQYCDRQPSMRAPPPRGSSTAKAPSCANPPPAIQETFGVGTQAADGMRLDRSYRHHRRRPQRPRITRRRSTNTPSELIASLADLRKAPAGRRGVSRPGAAQLRRQRRHAALVCSAPESRPRARASAQKRAPTDHSPRSYHARVLPDFLDVIDDPGLKTFDGKDLVGAYDIDDEGVPAQAVKLVTDGKLENYLIGRAAGARLSRSRTATAAPASPVRRARRSACSRSPRKAGPHRRRTEPEAARDRQRSRA